MWKVIHSCVQGTSHIKTKTPCQDVVKYRLINNGVILALSDGAGSAKHSMFGAEISCDTIIDCFTQDFEWYYNADSIKVQEKIIHRIRTRLGIKAKSLESLKEDFASTLLFICIQGDQIIMGHIGDGIIGAIKENELIPLSKPEKGEFANSTYFTTSRNYHAHFRLYKGKINNILSIFLMSDGAADCLYDKKNERFAKAILSFSSWMKHNNIDDVNRALFENMFKLFPLYTSDDCSFIMCQDV